MTRIFVRNSLKDLKTFIPDPDDCHYLLQVLRMRQGEEFCVVDAEGTVYNAVITSVGKKELEAELISQQDTSHEMKAKITLYQSVSKGERMDLTIQKSVELGVTKIVPVLSDRCVVKLDGKSGKSDRWQKIALEAARQSGRDIVPEVTEPVKFADAVKNCDEDIKIIPWEEARDETLKDILSKTNEGSIAVFIGPEGGFDSSEADLAIANGIKPVTLGPRILRTETAGPAVLAMINYALEL